MSILRCEVVKRAICVLIFSGTPGVLHTLAPKRRMRPNRRATQGKTTVYFGIASVPQDDVVPVQRRQAELLERAGYRIVSTDREFQAEAEVLFDGPAEGSAQITPVCQGTVQIRYRFSG